jgi:hypothetical protein
MTNSAVWSVRLVVYPPGQRPGLGFQIAVDALCGPGELDEPVAFHRGLAVDGAFGFGDCSVEQSGAAPPRSPAAKSNGAAGRISVAKPGKTAHNAGTYPRGRQEVRKDSGIGSFQCAVSNVENTPYQAAKLLD